MAYVADGYGGLVILNVNNPESISEVSSYNTSGNAYDLALYGNEVYVADGSKGLQIIDISDLDTPTLAGGIDFSGTSYGVWTSGDKAYLGNDYYGVRVIDVSIPTNPVELTTYDTLNARYLSGNQQYALSGRRHQLEADRYHESPGTPGNQSNRPG